MGPGVLRRLAAEAIAGVPSRRDASSAASTVVGSSSGADDGLRETGIVRCHGVERCHADRRLGVGEESTEQLLTIGRWRSANATAAARRPVTSSATASRRAVSPPRRAASSSPRRASSASTSTRTTASSCVSSSARSAEREVGRDGEIEAEPDVARRRR